MKFLLTIILAASLPFAAQADNKGKPDATSLHPLTWTVPMNNVAGLNLMNEAVKIENKEGNKNNVMLSPISYYLALSMAYNGTDNATRTDMEQWFGIFQGNDQFNASNKLFQDTLKSVTDPAAKPAEQTPEVGIYNSAWSNTAVSDFSGGTFDFSADYVSLLKESYDAEVQALNFKEETSVKTINAWANEKTKGLIPEVLDYDTLKKMFWVLMNATYLEARWEVEFDKTWNPQDKIFTKLDGNELTVDMIEQDAYYPSVEDADFDAVSIPFRNSDLAFYVVVPKSLKKFTALQDGIVWTDLFWANVVSQTSSVVVADKVKVILPKFTFAYNTTMLEGDELTKAVGLNFLFQDSADFAAMSAPGSIPTQVGLIKQDTKIELDEFGVKAAAVTTIGGIETTSMPADPEKIIKADKPFFFAIVAKTTGAILFTGSVVDPTAK